MSEIFLWLLRGGEGGVNIALPLKWIILVILRWYTKTQAFILPARVQKFVVCGGDGWWMFKPILVFSFGFDQAEQLT